MQCEDLETGLWALGSVYAFIHQLSLPTYKSGSSVGQSLSYLLHSRLFITASYAKCSESSASPSPSIDGPMLDMVVHNPNAETLRLDLTVHRL